MLSKSQVREIKGNVAKTGEALPHVFSALSDAGRFRIFKLLMRHDDLCVTDVANVFGISVPAASQQLKIMEISGLVRGERSGQMICYVIRKDEPLVRSLMRIIDNLEQL